ncbi:MAG: aminoacyl-tRNA hydrolase [Candidatus Shapirobacteria bacterium]|jgi:PTH1 family peptidyl-tRNA hydrolase
MSLFIGLGNPGSKYQSTRHNLGQNVILNLFQLLGLTPKSHPKLLAHIAQSGHFYAYTTTYMNESGISAQKIVNFYKIPSAGLYLIHDDLDLPVGEWRLQFGRGPAGHKGVESVVSHLGSQDFWRFRLGIGHPRDSSNPGLPVEDYVLMPFTPPEQVLIEAVIAKIITEIKNLHQS